MKKIIGVAGGSIGSNPMGLSTWSGSSQRFFSACTRAGLIHTTIGIQTSKLYKYYNAIANYSKDRAKWRTLFYTNLEYRNHMTKQLGKMLLDTDLNDCCLLQLGAEYNGAQAVNGRAMCASYNDGNFIMSSRSPYFPTNINTAQRNQAINFEKCVCKDMDRIFTMSQYLRNSFIDDYGASPDKVVCIGAGINLDCLPDIENAKDYSNGEMVFVGVEFERKGGMYLIEAFKYIKEKVPYAKLNIIGPNRLPFLINVDGVVFHGNLDRNKEDDRRKFNAIMQRSSLFVMPSLYEPFGIAPLEAMAYRNPCIVSNGWALPEIVVDDYCGKLVPIGNREVLGQTIIDLLKDPDTLQKYGDNGRAHVEKRFTWEGVARRLKECLMVD